MLSILIVEDTPQTLELLRDYLAFEFPYARIDAAETVEDALDLIRLGTSRGVVYKIAILDFMLPKSKDDPAKEIDTTLRSRLRESTSRDAVVFHITAYPSSPIIDRYLREEQLRSPEGARPVVISKLAEGSWTDQLYDAIRRVVHGDRIARRLDRLFSGVSARPDQPDVTHTLDTLLDDVEQYWDYLDAPLQARINRHFRVCQEGSKVTLDLL